jgi:lauroyl/myristoyl acyltransferase
LNLSRAQLAAQIESVEGASTTRRPRAAKGAIVATAHMGSFEAGAAGLLDREKAMHVVFKARRDPLRAGARRLRERSA